MKSASDEKKTPIVKKFSIYGLYGKKDIMIDMSRACTILIGENGLGKTTILSIINLVLSCQIHRLGEYDFRKIDVVFDDGIASRKFTIEKEEVDRYSLAYRYHSDDIDLELLTEIFKTIKDENLNEVTSNKIGEIMRRRPTIRKKYPIALIESPDHLMDFIKAFPVIFNLIHYCVGLNFEVEYLPTYRRIEADIHKILDKYKSSRISKERIYRKSLFDDDENAEMIENLLKERSSIQFGMNDIENLLNTFIDRISESSILGFSKVSGSMIRKLVEKDFTVKKTEFNRSEVEIVLQRSGRNLSQLEKERILEIVDNGEIYYNKYLVYFLDQLIDVYKSQRVFDTALKGFVSACNGFLVDKKFYYNESHLKIGLYYIQDEKHTKEISLNKLSSGEKQLISIMAKVYLKLTSEVILLIDEPELSLSIKWQKSFLPTLLKAGKCRQIIAVTHSPFIFSNELEENAMGSLEYVNYGK